MRYELLTLVLCFGTLASAQSNTGISDCHNPPCAPAVFLGIDDHSGQAELLCTNQNDFNCARLLGLDGKEVPVMEFPIGKGGTVQFDDGNGNNSTLTFTSFGGVKASDKGQILTFGGAKKQ